MSKKILIIKCPKCDRTIHTTTPFESSYLDPKFRCECGLNGTLSWKRGDGVVVFGKKSKKEVKK